MIIQNSMKWLRIFQKIKQCRKKSQETSLKDTSLRMKKNTTLNEILTGKCPYCPPKLSKKLYKLPNGLRIHCTKIHPDKSPPNMFNNNDSEITIESAVDKLAFMKKNIKVLKRIPKGARVVAAYNLPKIIDKCVQNNDVKSWCDLLFFSYAAFRIPDKKLKSSSLGRIVKNKINNL